MVATRETRGHFKFNLPAFLCAARSVLRYALKEAKKHAGGQAWYKPQMKNKTAGNATMPPR